MDAVIFILRIALAIALYAFLGALLWVLLRELRQNQRAQPAPVVPKSWLWQVPDVQEDGPGRRYEIQSAAWIGRDPNCLVCVDDEFASARHAQVLWRAEDDGWVVEDNLSRNGTFVNEARITRASLNDDDVIRIGRAKFKFRRESAPSRGQGA